MPFTFEIFFLPLLGVSEILFWKQSTRNTYTWASKSVSYRFIGIHVTSSATIDEWGGISHQHVMIGHLERLDWCVKDPIKTSQGLIQSPPINKPMHCPSLYVKLNSLASQVLFFLKQMHQFRSSSAYRLCLNNLLSNWYSSDYWFRLECNKEILVINTSFLVKVIRIAWIEDLKECNSENL